MNCIYVGRKSKKKVVFLYCKNLKTQITFDDCRNCPHKTFKTYKKLIVRKSISQTKYKKHKLTEATSISSEVKKIVWERDNHRCIYCGKLVPWTCGNSHFIKRSQLGLGIPQNIVTACPTCHYEYDFGKDNKKMIDKTKRHLKKQYDDWNIETLTYKKRN